jgi:hypothetical protein
MDLKKQCCNSVEWVQLAQCFQLVISCTQIPSNLLKFQGVDEAAFRAAGFSEILVEVNGLYDVTPKKRIFL